MGSWPQRISNYLEYLENVRSASAHTLRSYRSDLHSSFQNIPENVSESSLLSHLRQAQARWRELAPATRNRKAASLKSFLNWLYENRLLKKELAPHILAPKVPQKIPHFLSVDEAIATLKSYPDSMSPTELKDKTLFCLIYGLGLRVSEACQIRWQDIDWSRQQILITRKGNKDQWVPGPRFTFEVLGQWKSASPVDDFIWGADPLSTRLAYEMIRQRGRKAGLLKPLHPHALRHSYATHLLTSGADLRSLQELLGHASLSATQKYTHISIQELARTLETFHPLPAEKPDSDQEAS
ncbi:MAG: tyrosine-type recombinase/integrase [Bdellovibrionales bacterium]